MYNLDDVILYQQQDLDVATSGYVELRSPSLLLAPLAVNKRVSNDYVALVVARIYVNCRVANSEVVTSAEVDGKPVYGQIYNTTCMFTIAGQWAAVI